jgi:hypothetical protein
MNEQDSTRGARLPRSREIREAGGWLDIDEQNRPLPEEEQDHGSDTD